MSRKKKNKNSVQEFIGIETFTKRGLKTKYGEPCIFSDKSYKYFSFIKRKYTDEDMALDAGIISISEY